MGKAWAKLWVDTLNDAKLWRVPPDWRWCWCGLLLIGAERDNGGRLEIGDNDPHDDDTIAGTLRVDLTTWLGAREYFLRIGMLTLDDTTLVITNWTKRQARELTAAENQKRYRDRKKQGGDDGRYNAGDNGGNDNDVTRYGVEEELRINTNVGLSPLDACLEYLRGGQPVGGEDKFNPGAAVARLFTFRFGGGFPPNYGRLGRMARDLSGGYQALARVIWGCPLVEGDPHDYIAGLVRRHPGRRVANRQEADGGSQPAGNPDPQVAAIRRMRDAQHGNHTASGNGTGGTVGATE